uniref:Reverse transcriptase domain-containing protein n=1 Tax=Tanacetum cinerariifolium TaxID=118510 RepID=A0A6L2NA73_TANCI|nr:hypothetical protein [Tanacetum cinerariifolium]
MPNPEDIIDPTTVMKITCNYSTPTNNNQRISANPRNRQIAQPGMNMGQYRQMQMVGGNGGNQFRQYAWKNVGNQNRLIGVPGNANQNSNGNGNLVATRAEGNATGHNGNHIRLAIKMQFALTSSISSRSAAAAIKLNSSAWSWIPASSF